MKIVISNIKLEDGTITERVFDNISDYSLSIIKQTDLMDKKKKRMGFKVDGSSSSHSEMHPRDLLKEVRQGLEDLINSYKNL